MSAPSPFLGDIHAAWLDRAKTEGVNPCIGKFGRGPEGKTCRDCERLFARRFTRTYWKCRERADTGGAGSDHRLKWPACGRFAQAEWTPTAGRAGTDPGPLGMETERQGAQGSAERVPEER